MSIGTDSKKIMSMHTASCLEKVGGLILETGCELGVDTSLILELLRL